VEHPPRYKFDLNIIIIVLFTKLFKKKNIYIIIMTSSTYTILPDVGGNFLVRDFNDGGVVKTVYLPILREPFTITISAADRGRPFRRTDPETGETYTITTGRSDTDIIRERLRELIEVEIEVGMAQDINFLIEEEEGSPPVKILREQDWRDALRTGRNTFQVVRVRRGRQTISTSGFGKGKSI
jgi:hypothetical protein